MAAVGFFLYYVRPFFSLQYGQLFMRVDDFDFALPERLIAKYPLEERSSSRLLCVKKHTDQIAHNHFADIVEYLQPGDLLVFNDTKVIPARLFGNKPSGGKVEILLERLLNEQEAVVQIRTSKSPKTGSRIQTGDAMLEVTGRDNAFYLVKLASGNLPTLLEEHGHIPLPPYIDREDEALDKDRYQTVYSRVPGAVAAPTAGLHFDQPLLTKLAQRGVEFAYVTLHVGAGTFQPVRVENVSEHQMHKEYVEVDTDCCAQIRAAKARGNKIVAVGTTAVRSLESASDESGIKPFYGDTQIFIYPGYQFRSVDALITNFHLPKSTLLMLVSAFAGKETIMHAYRQAVEQQYRFFSYGDAMLLYSGTE